jgi:hypothetical protein
MGSYYFTFVPFLHPVILIIMAFLPILYSSTYLIFVIATTTEMTIRVLTNHVNTYKHEIAPQCSVHTDLIPVSGKDYAWD